jgi:hypothetical protein
VNTSSLFHAGTRIKRRQSVLSRVLADETVLLDPDRGTYFVLNETGTAVWAQAEAEIPLEAIHQALLELYEVAPERLWEDIVSIVSELHEHNLIDVVEGRTVQQDDSLEGGSAPDPDPASSRNDADGDGI